MALRFIHITDTHIDAPEQPGEPFLLHGADTKKHFELLAETIETLLGSGLPVDFLVHTGDLCNSSDVAGSASDSFETAAGILGSLSVPCLLLNGNHDRVDLIDEQFGPLQITPGSGIPLGDAGTRSRAFKLNDYILAFLDARPRESGENQHVDTRHPDDPAGSLPEDELKALQSLIQETDQELVVFLHYPPVPIDSAWIDQSMLISNGDVLHQLLATVPERVRGVFFGHVHHSVQTLRDQILYVACGAASCTFPAWPNGDTFKDAVSLYGVSTDVWFNYVAIEQNSVTIKQQTLSSKG